MTKNPTDPGVLPAVTDECVVPWQELSQRCGAPGFGGVMGTIAPEAAQWARSIGVTVRTHWTGVPGLTPSDAHKARVAHEAAVAEQNALSAAYREHTAEQKRQAARARLEDEKRQAEKVGQLEERSREARRKQAAELAAAPEGHGAVDTGYEAFKAKFRRSA